MTVIDIAAVSSSDDVPDQPPRIADTLYHDLVSPDEVAEVVRTTNDPYVGHVALVRVFSGTLAADSTVHVSGHLGSFLGHAVEGHDGCKNADRLGP